jgi:hypothetical protein
LPGLDLTFSTPKSVGVLFAQSDDEGSSVVCGPRHRGRAGCGYLEREAGDVRRGKDGIDRLPGGGFVAAAFRHRAAARQAWQASEHPRSSGPSPARAAIALSQAAAMPAMTVAQL